MSRNSLVGQASDERGRGQCNWAFQMEQSGRVKKQFRGAEGKRGRAGQIMKPW